MQPTRQASKTLFILLISVVLAHTGKAQGLLGISAGFTNATNNSFKNVQGISLGVETRYRIMKTLFIGIEADYDRTEWITSLQSAAAGPGVTIGVFNAHFTNIYGLGLLEYWINTGSNNYFVLGAECGYNSCEYKIADNTVAWPLNYTIKGTGTGLVAGGKLEIVSRFSKNGAFKAGLSVRSYTVPALGNILYLPTIKLGLLMVNR